MMFNLVNCKLWRKQMLSFINKQIYEKTSPFFGRLPASTHQSDSNICIGQHSQCNKRATHNIKIARINHRWVYSGFPVIWLVVFFMAWYKCDIFTFLPYAISVTYNSFFFFRLWSCSWLYWQHSEGNCRVWKVHLYQMETTRKREILGQIHKGKRVNILFNPFYIGYNYILSSRVYNKHKGYCLDERLAVFSHVITQSEV